jgi:cytochrome c oxidase assembly factor 2
LFAGTLLASFIVVGIPHVFPCPRPAKRSYADTQIQTDENGEAVEANNREVSREEQVRANQKVSTPTRSRTMEDEAALFQQLKEEAELLEKQARECPVPKPSGWVGRVLGFEGPTKSADAAAKTSTTSER